MRNHQGAASGYLQETIFEQCYFVIGVVNLGDWLNYTSGIILGEHGIIYKLKYAFRGEERNNNEHMDKGIPTINA